MIDTKLSRSELSVQIAECHATACFLACSVGLILEEHAGFTEKNPVSSGAENSLKSLADKLQWLHDNI